MDATTMAATPSGEPSRAFGQYRLLQVIGEGGMGEVWLAEQMQPIRRQLAIKLIKAGMDTRQVVARFEAERQALAVMDHPGIAKVFDAGSTPEGRPYFAMEYVRGEPITAYCDRHTLSLGDRLELFLQICDAVQHAHQKGIIHRDLKPSNVLVEVADGKARPKIIDFGIAKATVQPLTDRTLYTELGSVMGTPEYMSPEQAALSGQDVDTRTDVYALGVILYELLTGALPLDTKTARASGLDEVRRTIREVQPARPSARGGTAAHQLRGDLDWITMRALEKERTRRYGSVSDFAADLRRHLSNEPVLAGPPSVSYRASKFLRRHRLGVSIAAAGAVLLVTFAVAMAVQAQRIAQERDRANLEAQAAKQTSDFLTGLFTVSDPSEARGNTLTATQILDRGAADLGRMLKDQPEIRARLQTTIGTVYMNLGRYSAAEPLLKEATETLRRVAPDGSDTATALDALADLSWYQGHLADAERIYTELIASLTRRLGANHRDTLKAEYDLATTYAQQKQPEKAVAALQIVLDRQRRAFGPDDLDASESLNSLSSVYWRMGRYAESLPLAQQSTEVRSRLSGPDHPETLAGLHNVATTLDRLSRFKEAEDMYRDIIARKLRVQGPGHPSTAQTRHAYARLLQSQKRFAEAEAQLIEAHAGLVGGGSGAAGRVAELVTQLASLYTEWGKPGKAAEWRAKAPAPAPAKK